MSVFNYISQRLGMSDPIIVMPFGGYANQNKIFAQARVLEDEGIQDLEENSTLKNLWNSYKRFESDEKSDMQVKVIWEGGEKILVSDNEGYIYLNENHQHSKDHNTTQWLPLSYHLIEKGEVIHEVKSSVMQPAMNSDFGVISDMDDTIIQTGVTSNFKWRLLVNSFMKNSHQRLPLDGAQEFYKALLNGKSGESSNPFFYLSNSPWNLYEYLTSFLDNFDFPKGTLLMRDIGIGNLRSKKIEEGNKYLKIIDILESYPDMKFILIGDAGEKDLDIYLRIARAFPERILSIYIRAVDKAENMEAMRVLKDENKEIDILIVEEGSQMIKHGQAMGYCQ